MARSADQPADPPIRRTSLRLVLGLTIITLLTAVAGALVGLNYLRARNVAIEHVEENMKSFADRLAGRLEELSGNTAALVAMVASVPNAFLSPVTERIDDKAVVLRQVIANSDNIEGAYAGYPDGSFFHLVDLANPAWRRAVNGPADAAFAARVVIPAPLLSPALQSRAAMHVYFFDRTGKLLPGDTVSTSGFDPRARAWYRGAVNQLKPVPTGPYQMATTDQLGVTISQAHSGNHRIVIGADVVIDRLTGFFARERMTPRSIAFVIDGERKPVFHSDPAINTMIMAARAERDFDPSEITDPLLTWIGKAQLEPGKTRLVDVGGHSFVVMAMPIRSNVLFAGDDLVLAAPLDELMVSANRGLFQGLAIGSMIVAVGILIAVLIAHLITKSLFQLTESADRFQDLDFQTPIDVPSRVREISTLGTAMNRARDAIHTFTLYVPKEFVRKGVASGHFSGRSARRQDVTALFTDIYDFTTISEHHSPEDVVAMLSDYFDILNACVEAHGGTIIQFLGDSIFAMWNAPVADPDHAEHACRAALEMNWRLMEFNAAQRSRNLPEFETRCGIHLGPAVVGSVGASDRLQYSAMGDTINVASRLEGINKTYGTRIIASAAVVAACPDKSMFRPLGHVQAKGRAEALEIYEVAGP